MRTNRFHSGHIKRRDKARAVQCDLYRLRTGCGPRWTIRYAGLRGAKPLWRPLVLQLRLGRKTRKQLRRTK